MTCYGCGRTDAVALVSVPGSRWGAVCPGCARLLADLTPTVLPPATRVRIPAHSGRG